MEMNDNIFVPQVSEIFIPVVGQEFESAEDAKNFYNTYAKEAGFSIRIHNSKRRKDTNEVYWKVFTCSKEGKTDEKYQNEIKYSKPRSGERSRDHTRCGCEAKMSIVNRLGDTWQVSHFVEHHNHHLTTPSKVHLLRSHRSVSASKKSLSEQFAQANIPTWQQMRLFEIESGGPSSLGHTDRDLRNHQRDQRMELIGRDAESFVQHMAHEKRRDDNFYFSHELENGVFTRCFWADSISRNNYAFFGDAVVFDTTYNTNKYSMIFAPFVGVNHHRQTILFGCGFLSDERIESFEWLFSEFMKAMPTHVAPRVIITDQDQAIGRAVRNIFPTSFHRLCLWHITYKFPEKLGPVIYNAHGGDLKHIIWHSETAQEFEQRWEVLMHNTSLGSNEWLPTIYEIRHKWVPAYVKHIFAAGMYSSQRIESNHAFFKRYVDRRNGLMDFISRFAGAVDHQRHEELTATHTDLYQRPRMITGVDMEVQMSQVYTKAIFRLFQEELVESTHYATMRKSSNEHMKVYAVQRKTSGGDYDRQRDVVYHPQMEFMTCSCMLFEFAGYPCRHILRLLSKKDIMLLPQMYIMPRWTKNAKANPVFDLVETFTEEVSVASRLRTLRHESNDLIEEASLTQVSSNYVLKGMREMKITVRENNEAEGSIPPRFEVRGRSQDTTATIMDPQPIRAKGCGKRLKSSKEKGMTQSQRQCGHCSRTGHDRRTCPQFISSNTMNVEQNTYYPQLYSSYTEAPGMNVEENTYYPQFHHSYTETTRIQNYGFAGNDEDGEDNYDLSDD